MIAKFKLSSSQLLWICALPAAEIAAQVDGVPASVLLPAKEKLHIYLLMGQSNMAGRGKLGPEDETPRPSVLVFTLDANWEAAVEPITHDKPGMLGVGPGLSFGKVMAEKSPGITIGLVPCAVGGTPLKRWERGGDLYSNAVSRATLARRQGTLKGILWHQGESDSGNVTNASTYGERLTKMIQDFRADVGEPNLPVVAGQLGEFLYDRGPEHSPYARVVNEALAALPEKVPHTGCASSKGLAHKGDQLHFDAAAQRELGRRYAAEMLRLYEPPVVAPGPQGGPPSDAIVLFDGKDLSKWRDAKMNAAAWKVEKGYFEVAHTGDIFTREEFGDIQLHVEWASPAEVKGEGQGRGNSGVYLLGRYEIQVLDCFENKTYPDGQTAAFYGNAAPLVNACRRPGEWQTYEIIFHAPKPQPDGQIKPGSFTVLHNGVLVQDHIPVKGQPTTASALKGVATDGPVVLQDHGNPVRYRNIWLRKL